MRKQRAVTKAKRKASKAVKTGHRHAAVLWGELKQIERELVSLFGRTVEYKKRKAQLKRELAILVRKI